MINTDIPAMPGSALLSETDFALFDALQHDLRAPWSQIGSRVGLSPTAAKRRWHRLVDTGAIWTSTYPGPGSDRILAEIEVACVNRRIEQLCRKLSRQPRIMTLTQVTGHFNVNLTANAASLDELRGIINDVIGGAEGVQQIRANILTQTFREGDAWTIGALAGERIPSTKSPRPLRVSLDDPRFLAVLGELEKDPRVPAAQVSQVLGCSTAHARRFILGLTRNSIITQRVEMAPASSGWSHTLMLQIAADPHDLDSAVRKISDMPGTRLCSASTGGPSNLRVGIWLRRLEDASAVEHRIAAAGRLEVSNRSIVLKHYKRAGWMFDENEKRTEFIGWNG